MSGLVDIDEVLKLALAAQSTASNICNRSVGLILTRDFGCCSLTLRLQCQVSFPSILGPLILLNVRPTFAVHNECPRFPIESGIVELVVSSLKYSCLDEEFHRIPKVRRVKRNGCLLLLPR